MPSPSVSPVPSTISGIPSLSSSKSILSGIPSPSASEQSLIIKSNVEVSAHES